MITHFIRNKKLFICGDTHGDWKALNEKTKQIINLSGDRHIDLVICGDFGYWPKFAEEMYKLSNVNTYDGQITIYFCPGNHEDWWSLKEIEDNYPKDRIIPIYDNINYCTFGSIKSFGNTTFLFCGGADSIDKNKRILGSDWFPEEIITASDMYRLPDEKSTHIDVVISHTCPEIIVKRVQKFLSYTITENDPSREYLSIIFDMFRPKLWYFGHFHQHIQDIHVNTTVFTGLGCNDIVEF